jgi:hypothetical protein
MQKTPPKEQVKFNLRGTVVQVPTEFLLKHEGSKIAAITRSAMRVGDMAIPLPRDYEMFCHCVFYICNEHVQLPPSVRRKDFMKEMNYYGIPFDETLVNGGKCVSPSTSTSKFDPFISLPDKQQISPTTVTHQVGASEEPRMPSPLDLLSSAMSTFIDSSSRPSSPAAPDHYHPVPSGDQTYVSPLDLLSSAISTTDGSWSSVPNTYATQHPKNPNVRKAMCGKCEVCLRDDCGECNFCLDKPKFGGPNRLRKKCLMRRCPNMHIVPTFDASFYSSALAKPLSIDGTESPEEDNSGKIAALHAEKRWFENLECLRPCIVDGGLINYALISDDDTRNRIKNYVKECRKQRRRIENNESTSLTEERLRLLEEANFPWSHTPYVVRNEGSEVLEKEPTSSLDLLCSITSQSFGKRGPWNDYSNDEDDIHDDEDVEKDPSDEPEEPESRQPIMKRFRGLNCGTCANCKRDDCGECRACIDKPKFGGPNKSRRRCYHRRCLIRKERLDLNLPKNIEMYSIPLEPLELSKTVNRNAPKRPGGKSEEEKMMLELANIRAELDAKARGVKYGLKMRSVPSIDNLAKEIEDEDSEDDESAGDVEDMSSDDGGDDAKNDDDAHRKPRIFTAPTSTERGVTIRPSGKWVSFHDVFRAILYVTNSNPSLNLFI